MRRRDLFALLAGTTAAWPLTTRAQQNAMPMIGMILITTSPSFHLMLSKRMLAPMITTRLLAMDTMAWDTNILIESTSDVRLVSNLEEVVC